MALVGGVIYPAAVQALVVNPNQKDREALYLERNIEATRQALDIVDVEVLRVPGRDGAREENRQVQLSGPNRGHAGSLRSSWPAS